MYCSLYDFLYYRRPQCDGSGPAGGTEDEGADEETDEEAEKTDEKTDEEEAAEKKITEEEEANKKEVADKEKTDWRIARTRQQIQQAPEVLGEVSIYDQNEEEEDSH